MSFQALCSRFIPDACRVKDFSVLYMIRKIKEGGRFFIIRSGSERLTINLAGRDHRWRNTVIQIHEAWETVMQKDRETVSTAWSNGILIYREILITVKVNERV